MGRRGVSYENKLEAVERYERGEGSLDSIARDYGVKKISVWRWIAIHESMGPYGLAPQSTNRKYSVELKVAAIESYLRNEGSYVEISNRYHIRSASQLQAWVTKYNGHKEFRTTGVQRREIHMTKGRLTTLDERIEIVSYCIANGKDYDSTVKKYGVSYQQIYNWVKKYEAKGFEALIDKRGKPKPQDDMNEVELLQAQNKMLKAENRQKEMEIAVLKKLQEIERRRG